MSYRNDASTAYDSTLLSSVPDPTRAERQEGYNVDLLDERPDRSPPAPAPDRQPLTDGYSAGAAVAYAHKEGQLGNGAERTGAKGPWYRTRWGITAIVIVIVLIVAGAVGGAVGGSHHNPSKSRNDTSNGGNGSVGTGSNSPTSTTSKLLGGSGNGSTTLSQASSIRTTSNPNPAGTPGISPNNTVTPGGTPIANSTSGNATSPGSPLGNGTSLTGEGGGPSP